MINRLCRIFSRTRMHIYKFLLKSSPLNQSGNDFEIEIEIWLFVPN